MVHLQLDRRLMFVRLLISTAKDAVTPFVEFPSFRGRSGKSTVENQEVGEEALRRRKEDFERCRKACGGVS